MSNSVLGWIALEVVGFVVLLWISWQYFDFRYRGKQQTGSDPYADRHWERTKEVFVDPKNGKTYRVYYNPQTGDRQYREE